MLLSENGDNEHRQTGAVAGFRTLGKRIGFNGGAKHRTRENAQKPARPIFIVAASAALYHTRRRANAGNGVGGRHREMSDKIIIAEKN